MKCMVSGVAMGLVDSSLGVAFDTAYFLLFLDWSYRIVANDDAIILSDIAELEDFIGAMCPS